MPHRLIAARPRAQDKRGDAPPRRIKRVRTLLRRYRPPIAPFGLWELPDGFGTTVLR